MLHEQEWLSKLLSKKDLVIKSAKTTSHGIEIHGFNRTQEFIEYYTAAGKFKGMLLRVLDEGFWQVWNSDRQVVVEPIPEKQGSCHTIGARSRKRALVILFERMKAWAPKA